MARSRVRTRREKRAELEPDSGGADVAKKIVRRGAQYCVVSEDGSQNFGCFATRAAAVRRLGQVESFKDEKAVWTTAFVNSLPDSAFLHVRPGGKKDGEGKTVPRDLRMFPIRNQTGAVDLPHLRNALARIPQSNLSQEIKDRLAATARRLLDRETQKRNEGHFHLFGGVESSRAFGPGHTHRVPFGDGTIVISTPSDVDLDHLHEIFLGSIKIESGASLIDETGLAKGLLPRVLSWTAVSLGEMSAFGSSGLEKSLEGDVPPRFRYWTAKTEDEARSVRDALVEAQVFTPENVRKMVGGGSRRTISETKVYLAKESEEAAELEPARGVEIAGARLVVADADVTIVAADVVDALDPARVGELLKKSEPWVAVVNAGSDRLPAIRAASRKVFRLRTRPGVAFATSQEELVPSVLVEEERPLDDDVSKALRGEVVFLVSKADEEQADERFVLGVVLEPDVVDSQKDTYDVATVRATAHKYMSEFQNVGLMHRKIINNKATVVQSFLAPVAMEIAGTKIKVGTWLVGMIFDDADIWASIKSGKLTSFSIGGDAVRKPIDATST